MSTSRITFLFYVALMMGFSLKTFAQCPGSPPAGIDCVAAAGSKDITAYSQCRSITNNHASGKALMVPTSTSTEWASFYGATIAGVTIGMCGADPCASKSIGQAADSSTALCAGTFEGGKYMIMPSGCATGTTNPACAGNDINTWTWDDGNATAYDIPTITNVSSPSTPSSSAERGHVTTPIIAAISAGAQGGPHAAARYCNDMTYGGFTDWYLPSKSELSYIYCLSSPANHDITYPDINPNCGGSGPTNQLTGFANDYYWSSTEYNASQTNMQNFDNGEQLADGKNTTYMVRCVRRY